MFQQSTPADAAAVSDKARLKTCRQTEPGHALNLKPRTNTDSQEKSSAISAFFCGNPQWLLVRSAGRPVQTIRNGMPFICFGQGFDHDQLCARCVAFVQLGVDGSRERLGVMWNHVH